MGCVGGGGGMCLSHTFCLLVDKDGSPYRKEGSQIMYVCFNEDGFLIFLCGSAACQMVCVDEDGSLMVLCGSTGSQMVCVD
jgi:hypothetical protein